MFRLFNMQLVHGVASLQGGVGYLIMIEYYNSSLGLGLTALDKMLRAVAYKYNRARSTALPHLQQN
jgi:hypothetical protein